MMITFLERLTSFCVVLAVIIAVPAIISAEGAPQQAAAAAVGVFMILVPYALARVAQASKTIDLLEQLVKECKE